MRRDAVLRHPVHFVRAYLYLKRRARASYQSRVERLIHVRLRHGDKILETPRHRLIHLMYYAKCGIAILYIADDNTHGEQIIYLVDCLILAFHLFVDAEKVLHAPINLRVYPRSRNVFRNLVHKLLDILFARILAQRDLLHQIIVSVRFKIL